MSMILGLSYNILALLQLSKALYLSCCLPAVLMMSLTKGRTVESDKKESSEKDSEKGNRMDVRDKGEGKGVSEPRSM